jgi:hypothetical protein
MIDRGMSYMVACLFVAMLFACAHDARHKQEGRSVDEIVRSATVLEGQMVSVKGYLRFGDDSRNLWSNEAAYTYVSKAYLPPGDPAWNRCIALYDINDWRDTLLSMSSQYVLISGIVRRYPARDGDLTIDTCSDIGISIRLVEPARS